jgi:hypothetical protein
MKIRKEHIVLIVTSLIIGTIKFFFHELWKDEWQSWLVARDLPLVKMISFMNYEGHPALWYLWLKPFTLLDSFVREDILLNIAHLFLVIAVMYYLLIKMEMPFLIKCLIIVSYFIFFEYGVVNRGYILVILFSLMAIHYFRAQHMLYFGVSLILLCQTEVYGVILATALLIFYYLKNKFFDLRPYVYGLVGLILFVLTVFPRGNKDDFERAYNKIITSHHLSDVTQGHLANIFAIGLIDDTATVGYTRFGILLSFFIAVLTIYIFFKSKETNTMWVLGSMMFILFSLIIYAGGVRQWGMIFLLFMMCIELTPSLYTDRLRMGIIVTLLICPFAHNLKAIVSDIRLPFSNALNAGKFIRKTIPKNVAIVAINKFETAPVAAYANREFYELPSGTPFTYFKWLERVYIPTQSELILFAKFKKARGIVVITHEPIDNQRFPLLKLWKKFDQENFKSEEYYIYLMQIS